MFEEAKGVPAPKIIAAVKSILVGEYKDKIVFFY